MRADAEAQPIEAFLRALGSRLRTDHAIYLTGGATAVLHGWRASTRDVDVLPRPDSDELLHAISELKERHDINVELASALDFLPAPADWEQRSASVGRYGRLSVFHLDYRLQALAKVNRAFTTDLADVDAMLDRGLVTPDELRDLHAEIAPRLFRHPSIDPRGLAERLDTVLDRRTS